MTSHHGLYDSVLEQDEEKDMDRHKDLAKAKLTLTECFIAIAIGITFASMHADFLSTSFPFPSSHPPAHLILCIITCPLADLTRPP